MRWAEKGQLPQKPGQAGHRGGEECGVMLACLFSLGERVPHCCSEDLQTG